MEKLEGKIAVIMGGNSGGGFVIVQRFVADSAHIFYHGGCWQSKFVAAVEIIGKKCHWRLATSQILQALTDYMRL